MAEYTKLLLTALGSPEKLEHGCRSLLLTRAVDSGHIVDSGCGQ